MSETATAQPPKLGNVSHSIITPECRTNRGDDGAFAAAAERAKAQYDQIVKGWAHHPTQPTLHLILQLQRPAP